MTIDRESEAYREAIEVMRAERDRHEMYGHVRTEGYCACGHPKDGPFYTRVEWERHVEDCVLSALLAPSRVTCPTCEGERVFYDDSGLADDPTSVCTVCNGHGTVEGPPVIYGVLGIEPDELPVSSPPGVLEAAQLAEAAALGPYWQQYRAAVERAEELDVELSLARDLIATLTRTRGPK